MFSSIDSSQYHSNKLMKAIIRHKHNQKITDKTISKIKKYTNKVKNTSSPINFKIQITAAKSQLIDAPKNEEKIIKILDEVSKVSNLPDAKVVSSTRNTILKNNQILLVKQNLKNFWDNLSGGRDNRVILPRRTVEDIFDLKCHYVSKKTLRRMNEKIGMLIEDKPQHEAIKEIENLQDKLIEKNIKPKNHFKLMKSMNKLKEEISLKGNDTTVIQSPEIREDEPSHLLQAEISNRMKNNELIFDSNELIECSPEFNDLKNAVKEHFKNVNVAEGIIKKITSHLKVLEIVEPREIIKDKLFYIEKLIGLDEKFFDKKTMVHYLKERLSFSVENLKTLFKVFTEERAKYLLIQKQALVYQL
ncbi:MULTISPECIES: hypothetical protein [Providencia]|uniref:hypothetical protein n=1 Tax=Providencia TaxID=586 RepID=UPI000447DBA8|nr:MULTISPECIES: hypothetical protein [Providencia]ETT04490.1 hypothetical protein HMPREF1562_3959 [Providencia alcalifaciens F90-2004]EUC96809.1 hypothetical protein HMPREF1567_0370 [Providencia alcalifaciens PAL-2]EUD03460.1 hypothetical protein HMPREF1565_3832 [Providencia alcalifaciens RIMD 1656011]MTB32163.1 hypothetical protein [Providencia alcalifaciens]MTC50274.1 hypothetical protein [Providencia alcalifaciens]